MHAQRGTSLIEMLLVAGILAMISSVAFLTFGARPFEMRSSATIFDAQLAHAKTIAATNGGSATLFFAAGPGGSGTVVSLVPEPSDVPPQTLRAELSEAALGQPPFSISIDAYGHAVAPQPCPAAGGFTLTFAAGPASETRFLPCPVSAAGAPEPVGTMPP